MRRVSSAIVASVSMYGVIALCSCSTHKTLPITSSAQTVTYEPKSDSTQYQRRLWAIQKMWGEESPKPQQPQQPSERELKDREYYQKVLENYQKGSYSPEPSRTVGSTPPRAAQQPPSWSVPSPQLESDEVDVKFEYTPISSMVYPVTIQWWYEDEFITKFSITFHNLTSGTIQYVSFTFQIKNKFGSVIYRKNHSVKLVLKPEEIAPSPYFNLSEKLYVGDDCYKLPGYTIGVFNIRYK